MPIRLKIGKRSPEAWQGTLVIMCFAQMVSMIGFSSIFPFLPLYVKSLGTVTSLSADLCTGLVFSGQAFSMMIASPIWAPWRTDGDASLWWRGPCSAGPSSWR